MAMSSMAAGSTAGRSCHERASDRRPMRSWREALTWVGTPYRHQGSRKGVGCDCLGLVLGVWRAIYGAEPERPDPMRRTGRRPAARTACSTRRGGIAGRSRRTTMPPGDLLLFRWRPHLPAKHAGILVEPDRFVHAYQGNAVIAVGAGAAMAQAHRRRLCLSRPDASQLMPESRWQPFSCRPRARSIGGLLGPVGSAIGAAAGALAGYAIDQALINGTRRIEGPRLSGARPFTAEEGAAIPRVYGTARVGGTLIWATRFEESADDAPARRQGRRRRSPNTAISPMSPSRSARARSPASGGSGPTGARSTGHGRAARPSRRRGRRPPIR